MVPHSEGINLTEELNMKKRNNEGSDAEQGEKKKSKYIYKIARRVKKVFDRQCSERKKLESVWQERKCSLEKLYKLEIVAIQSMNCSEAVSVDKLKISESKHKQKLEALNAEMSNRVKDMKARHYAEREAEEKDGVGKMKTWEENVLVHVDKSKSPSATQMNDETAQSCDEAEMDNVTSSDQVRVCPLSRFLEATNQEEQRRPTNNDTSFPDLQQFDPLQKEYERMCEESNQVVRSNEEKVSQLMSERDKEIEELERHIRRKYESMVREAQVSFVEKKEELEQSKFKVVMNMRLAQAIRAKYEVASDPFRSLLAQSSLRSEQHGCAVEEVLMRDSVICLEDG